MPHRHAVVLLLLIVVGVILGVLAGWVWGEAMLSVKWLGDLFLNALKMLIIPLIFAAVISGIASLGDIRKLGRIGAITVGYYAASTGLAVLIGLAIVNLIRPGAGVEWAGDGMVEGVAARADVGLSDIVLSLVTPN
ncbi:MAG: dicarboxylate/amino acid:cation symporter, partial [Alphaproteobacteria bacterium]